MTSKEYTELKALSRIEPVGSDALVIQTAIVAQSMSGGKLDKVLVYSQDQKQSPEIIYELFKQFGAMESDGNSSGSGHPVKGKNWQFQ